jgi:hypothetical protein
VLLCTGSRPLEGVPEAVGAAADKIMEWVRERGPQWKTARIERARSAKEAEERRAAEGRAEEARRKAEEVRRKAEEGQAVIARQAEAARLRDLLALFDDDEAGDTAGAGDVGTHMEVDEDDVAGQLLGGSAAPAGIAAAVSTGGTAADDEGEDEQEVEPEDEQSAPERGLGMSAGGKEAAPGTRVVPAAAGAKGLSGKDDVEDKRTAAERVEFRKGVHEVRTPGSVGR